MRIIKQLSFFIIMTVILVVIVEVICRIAFRYDVALIRDPDHRLPANTGETNADGIRSDREAAEFKEDDLNIIFLGDSFVYGLRQHPQLAFPRQFERLARSRHPGCKINAANFGWISSSPYLSLRLLKDIGKKYAPDVVFLSVDMTDFHDDLKYRQLIEKQNPVYKGIAYVPGIITLVKKIIGKFRGSAWAEKLSENVFGLPIDRFFIVNQPLDQTERFGSAIFDSINDIAEFSENELGARFILMMYPRSFQYSRRESPKNWEKDEYELLGPYSLAPFDLFEDVKGSLGFPAYSLLGDFQTTDVFPTVMYDDPHWTEKGLRLVAEKVYDISQAENVFACAGGTPDPSPRAVEFDCAGERVLVTFRGDEATITVADKKPFSLARVRSASGARFSDGERTFWTKGREATMELGKAGVSQCEEVIPRDAR